MNHHFIMSDENGPRGLIERSIVHAPRSQPDGSRDGTGRDDTSCAGVESLTLPRHFCLRTDGFRPRSFL
jgi:hypothetical protein